MKSLSGENFYGKKDVVIKLRSFKEWIERSAFEGADLLKALEDYFGEKIIHKKSEKEDYERERKRFFSEKIEWYSETPGARWLSFLIKREESALYNAGFELLIKEYNYSIENGFINSYDRKVELVISALNNLPIYIKEYKILPIFASEISRDPHFFDISSFSGKLLLHGICYLFNRDYPLNAEERVESYLSAGLLIDDISNNVIVCGLEALSGEKNEKHNGWYGFFERKELFILPLSAIISVKYVFSENRKVIVIENPAVFRYILQKGIIELDKVIPMICTYGMVKVSALLLMDKLVVNGSHLYYSGDIDPEGIQIADKLKLRYKEKLTLLGYEKENYHKYISDVDIKEISLKKLDKIKSEELSLLIEELRLIKKKTFQEGFLEELYGVVKELSQ